MDIRRMQVEGGFLDGFDVKFSRGLNVLIGARGTGKTSVIELIRFALGARNHTGEAAQRSAAHAAAVLEDGVVTVELDDVLDAASVSRASGAPKPDATASYEVPLIFSQTEIENLGLSEAGRLRLIDDFVPDARELADQEAAAIAAIRSAFKEILAVEQERAALAAGLDGLDERRARIAELEAQERGHRATSVALADKQARLAAATGVISDAAVKEDVLGRFEELMRGRAELISREVADDAGVEGWDEGHGDDPLARFRAPYQALMRELRSIAGRFDALSAEAAGERANLAKSRQSAEAEARAVRTEVEQSVAGAGAVARQVSQLRTEVAQLQSRRRVVEERDERIKQLRARRDQRIAALDSVRTERFARRRKVAAQLTKALSPQIQVAVEQYGQYAEYNRALTDALRGSGMRYADLVSALGRNVSPQELVGYLDSDDFVGLADIAGIPKDRAARLLAHLREIGAADIVTASIEDNVRMKLLDGVDYKDVERLSAGQRCTVVLSVVLQHGEQTLVIDQPEDHLDNAYIATTVIKAIRGRKAAGQLIISTHNANIPVLGEADLVVEMTSDGRNGFVQVCGELTSAPAVEAITNVMEGGRAAFTERAAFYDEHEAL
jgi:shikimate kinase